MSERFDARGDTASSRYKNDAWPSPGRGSSWQRETADTEYSTIASSTSQSFQSRTRSHLTRCSSVRHACIISPPSDSIAMSTTRRTMFAACTGWTGGCRPASRRRDRRQDRWQDRRQDRLRDRRQDRRAGPVAALSAARRVRWADSVAAHRRADSVGCGLQRPLERRECTPSRRCVVSSCVHGAILITRSQKYQRLPRSARKRRRSRS
jgi:hypothetical protein